MLKLRARVAGRRSWDFGEQSRASRRIQPPRQLVSPKRRQKKCQEKGSATGARRPAARGPVALPAAAVGQQGPPARCGSPRRPPGPEVLRRETLLKGLGLGRDCPSR